MQWQKQELSDRVVSKVEKALTPVVGMENFFTDVKISTGEYEKPEFNKTDEEVALETQQAKDEEKAKKEEEEKIKAEAEEDEKKLDEKETKVKKEEEEAKKLEGTKGKITFKSVDPTEMPKDYIVFSKLGMEAPLIDDFNDFRPDGKIVLTMPNKNSEVDAKNTERKLEREFERQRRLDKEKSEEKIEVENKRAEALEKKLNALKSKPKPSAVEQVWKYNESIDIFKNIKALSIVVSINEDLSEDTRKTVNSVLTKINFNVDGIKPKLEIKYIKFGVLKEQVEEGFLSMLSRYSTAIGFVLGTLILGAVAWVLFQQYEKLKRDEAAAAAPAPAAAPQNNDKDDDDDKEEPFGAGGPGMATDGDGSLQYDGIERFRTFLSSNKESSLLLIKKWISMGGQKEKASLRAIVQQLDNKELAEVFSDLNEVERSSWKDFLEGSLSNEELLMANNFISNQIVEEIIVPDKISDPEIIDILMRIEPENAALFIKKNRELGHILLNVLNNNLISQVFESFDDSELEMAVAGSLQLKDLAISEVQLAAMKKALSKFKQTKEKLPFVKKLLALIPLASPGRETILFHSLAKVGDRKVLYSIAEEYYPAELVMKLPDAFIKGAMQNYALEKRIEILSVLDEENKAWLMAIIAPDGSKAFDMINLEFENCAEDINFKRKIEDEGDQIHKEFIDYIRSEIEKDESFTGDVLRNIEEYVDDLVGTGTNTSQLEGLNDMDESDDIGDAA
jgi:hypothetical protein